MLSGTLSNHEEPHSSESRDNDAKHKKVLTIRSQESEDLGRVSYIPHVSESQGKDQDSAVQPDFKNALNQVFQSDNRSFGVIIFHEPTQ